MLFGDDGQAPGASSGQPGEPGGSSGGGSSGVSDPVDAGPPPRCGDPEQPLCVTGEACRGNADCESSVCDAALCAAPSPTDGVRNGDESDVDCGGATAPACAVGKECAVHADCASEACPSGRCVSSRSCRRHFGGDTCGAGEVGAANAEHEDCCLSIQPGEEPYRVDKYLITAGRMRAFLDEVRSEFGGVPNVRAWVAAHPERVPSWNDAWVDSLPRDQGELVRLIGTGQNPGAGWSSEGRANGCFVQSGGAPTYGHAAADLAAHAGDMERAFTQDELDVKALNCTPAAMFLVFCEYDGGTLPSSAQWAAAVRGQQTEAQRLFPWGNPVGTTKAAVDQEISLRASYNKNYHFPPTPPGVPVAADGYAVDRALEVPAPGRFPLGAGPFGHADLLGVAETILLDGVQLKMVRQYAFQEAYYGVQNYGRLFNRNGYTSHYAVTARCVRPL